MTPGFSVAVNERIKTKVHFTDQYDNIHFRTANVEFALEGVILNRKQLMQQNAVSSFGTYILEKYRFRSIRFVDELEGEFRGFLHDSSAGVLYLFCNITSTQRVFYTRTPQGFFADSSLVRLNTGLKKFSPTRPDRQALYQLMALGNLLEDRTIIEGVLKIPDGCFLELDTRTLDVQVRPYFSVEENEGYRHSKARVVDRLHEVFQDSVLLEYEKDEELSTGHLSLLSGGLDSRVGMMYAMKNDKIPDNVFCFSQSGYYDETISRKIAEDYNLHYEFIPLDEGNFLKKIDHLTYLSEGSVVFTGGIHVQHAVEQMQYRNFSLFHSGQIGDGVLGGFNSVPKRVPPTSFKIVTYPRFLHKVENELQEAFAKYDSEEKFLLRNLAFNRTFLGALVFQQKAYQTSPFMTRDFLKLALSLPEEWKFKHRLYLQWIAKHCPEAVKYRWERTLMKPDAAWKTRFGDEVVKRGFKIINEKIMGTPQKASMYPYQYYFESSPDIQEYYQKYFDENLYRIEAYPELMQDVITLFGSPAFADKALAVNVLSVFKLFFGE